MNAKMVFIEIYFSMAALLAKFRIDFSDVVVIPDVTKRAKDETRTEFNSIIDSLPEGAAILFFNVLFMAR